MKNKLLVSTAALVAGIAVASAQNMPGGAPSRDGAQPGQAQDQDKRGQQGQAKQGESKQGQAKQGDAKQEPKQGQAKQGDVKQEPKQGQAKQGDAKQEPKQGQAKQEPKQAEPKQGQAKQGDAKQEPKQGQAKQQPKQGGQPETTGQGRRDQGPAQTERQQAPQQQEGQGGQQGQTPRGQAEQGQAGGRVTLTTEQRTRVRQTVLSGRNVPRVTNVNFSISIGTVVPRSVTVVEVPQTLIEIRPEWRGHLFFVVRDEIVIVDRSHKIVAIVPAGSSGAALQDDDDAATLTLSSVEIRRIQVVLREKGFDIGEPDGVLGPRTQRALIAFQRQQGLQVSGRIDSRTIVALGLTDMRGGTQGQSQTTGQGSAGQGSAGQGSAGQDNMGKGGDSTQRSPADQQGSAGGNSSTTTGQGGDRMQPPPANNDSTRPPAARAPQNDSSKGDGRAPMPSGQAK